MNRLIRILPNPFATVIDAGGTRKFGQRLRAFIASVVVLCSVAPLPNLAHGGAAVINLGDDFYVIPVFDRYVGSSDLTLYIPFLDTVIERALERLVIIDIFKNGSVRVTGEDSSVPGNLSGNTVTATFAVNAGEGESTCDGFLILTGNISGNTISGTVTEVEDSLTCSGGLLGTEPITSTVDGTFTTTK